MGTYINSLSDAGLAIEHLVEPPATGQLAERVPGYKEVPVAMVLACKKR